MLELSPQAARRIAVDRQGFAARTRTATVAEVEKAIERLGMVQIDSVTAVDRAHRLTLAARLGRLPDDGINKLRRQGRVFEYWAHEACLLPVSEWRYFAHVRRRREHPWWGGVLKEHPDLVAAIMAAIDERGPLSARSFGGAGKGYWEWTPAKRVFEALWTAGDLAVYERRGFERMYDLTERVIPAEHRATEPDDAETLRHFMRRTLRSRGVVTRQRLADYYRTPGGMKRLAEPVADLVAAGEAIECRVGEWDALCDPAAAELAESPPAPDDAGAAVPVRQSDLGSGGDAPAVRLLPCARDLQAEAGPRVGLLRAAAAGRRPHRRARRPEVGPQGRAAAPARRALGGTPGAGAAGPRDGAAVARAGASAEQRGERLEVVAHHAPLAEVRLDVVAAAGRIDLVGLRDRAGEILVAVDDQPRLAR